MEFSLIGIFVVLFGYVVGPVFQYSNAFIVFIWFWLFSLSQMSFFMLLSAFFSNGKTASLVGMLLT